MATKQTLEEMETHCNLVANDRSTWELFSDDPVMLRKLDKIATAYKTSEFGKWYRLASEQIRFYQALTAEERKRRASRAKFQQSDQQDALVENAE